MPAMAAESRSKTGDPREAAMEFSLRLSRQVTSLEAENTNLQDSNTGLAKQNAELTERVQALERDLESMRQFGVATYEERQHVLRHADNVVKEKMGEAMLANKRMEEQRQRNDTLAADNARLRSITERLEGEMQQLQRAAAGLEATNCTMQAELMEQAAAGAHAARRQDDLHRHVRLLSADKQRADELAGTRHYVDAKLRVASEEIAAERLRLKSVEERLAASLGEVAKLRQEAAGLMNERDGLRAEVVSWQHAEGVAAAAQPALQQALHRESGSCQNLRNRVAELEGIFVALQRKHTFVEAENASLRSTLNATRAELERCSGTSAQLVADVCGAHHFAESQEQRCLEADQRLAAAASDGARLRRRGEALGEENDSLHARVLHLEAENTMLKSNLRGAEVVVSASALVPPASALLAPPAVVLNPSAPACFPQRNAVMVR